MIFKWFFAAATAASFFYFLIAARKAVQRLFVAMFFLAGLVVIIDPDLSNRLAHSVGIGRGADLVLYLSTLFLFVVSFSLYLRSRRLEDALAMLVRELSIRFPLQEGGRDMPPPDAHTGQSGAPV
jgi:hypothetical protein